MSCRPTRTAAARRLFEKTVSLEGEALPDSLAAGPERTPSQTRCSCCRRARTTCARRRSPVRGGPSAECGRGRLGGGGLGRQHDGARPDFSMRRQRERRARCRREPQRQPRDHGCRARSVAVRQRVRDVAPDGHRDRSERRRPRLLVRTTKGNGHGDVLGAGRRLHAHGQRRYGHGGNNSLEFPLHVSDAVCEVPAAVQQIFTQRCSPCHTTGSSGGLHLDPASASYANLVGVHVASAACSSRTESSPAMRARATSSRSCAGRATSAACACRATCRLCPKTRSRRSRPGSTICRTDALRVCVARVDGFRTHQRGVRRTHASARKTPTCVMVR